MSNRFALLSDDASDTESSRPAPVAASTAPAAKSTSASAAPAKQQQSGGQRTKSDYPSRGAPRKVYGGDRPLAGADATESDLSKDNRAERNVGQRGGRGSGNRGPRGGRGGRGSGGNRPMDRHSQTDRVDSAKQEHQAWGGDEGKRELADENRGVEDALADASGVATPVNGEPSSSPAAAAPAAEENAQPAEPEDNTRTFDQWRAEQSEKTLNVNLPTLQERQANEGADDSQWKNAVALSKKDDDEEAFYAGSGKDASKARKRPQKEGKTYIEVEPRFSGPARGGRGGDRGSFRGRGRGDRPGRGRGGNPRSERSSNNNSSAAVDTSDASAFPSLS